MNHNRPVSYFTSPELIVQQSGTVTLNTTQTNIATELGEFYALVNRYCLDYSNYVLVQCNRTFVPYKATKTYYTQEEKQSRYLYSDVFGNYHLELNEDLLTVGSITVAGTVLTTTQYRFKTDEYPYRELVISSDANVSFEFDFDETIVIIGEWGYADDPNNLYTTIETLSAGINASVTTINVTLYSAYKTFEYIKIDDELMLITATTDGTPDTITVTRGVNGTTAASHLISVPIKRWNVVPIVREVATRDVTFAYDSRNNYGTRIEFLGGGAMITSQGIDAIEKTIKLYKAPYIGGII